MSTRSRLIGSFPLTSESVARHAPEGVVGVYAMGFLTSSVFTVQAVGRSDSDLRGRLAELAQDGKYQSFKYLAANSVLDAFELECLLFHEFGGARHLDNASHPARPGEARWPCPHCTIYGIPDWGALAR